MTGLPQFNYPVFDAAANDLRSHLKIVSPAEMDDPQVREEALASPDGRARIGDARWRECLRRDVDIVMDEDCVGVIVLEGWERSVGARLETYVAEAFGKDIFEYRGPEIPLRRIDRTNVLATAA